MCFRTHKHDAADDAARHAAAETCNVHVYLACERERPLMGEEGCMTRAAWAMRTPHVWRTPRSNLPLLAHTGQGTDCELYYIILYTEPSYAGPQ